MHKRTKVDLKSLLAYLATSIKGHATRMRTAQGAGTQGQGGHGKRRSQDRAAAAAPPSAESLDLSFRALMQVEVLEFLTLMQVGFRVPCTHAGRGLGFRALMQARV